MDRNSKPEFATAESVEISEDQLRYTFRLRNTHWSDGIAVTAYDFEKTWKTNLDPSFPCDFAQYLYFIKNAKRAKQDDCTLNEIGVKALDDYTLQVDLEYPVPYLLSALSIPFFYPTPSHVVDSQDEWTLKNYVGNGAFRLVKWLPYNSITVEKNPCYWDQKNVHLDKISLSIVQDPTTALSMYENHELDWAGSPFFELPEDSLASLKKKGELEEFSIAGTYFYGFNTQEIPFNNVHIRRAFSLAIDRTAIIDGILQLGQAPAMGIVPPTMWESQFPISGSTAIEEANLLFQIGLSELNLTKEQLPSITLSYNTDGTHHKIAQAIQQQWNEAFGIHINLENKEWKVFLDELKKGKLQIARVGLLAAINDPSLLLNTFRYTTSGMNSTNWVNLDYSEMLALAEQTADPKLRMDLLKKAEKILFDEMPIAPIFFYKGSYLKRPYVKDVYISELIDIDLKWAYIETE